MTRSSQRTHLPTGAADGVVPPENKAHADIDQMGIDRRDSRNSGTVGLYIAGATNDPERTRLGIGGGGGGMAYPRPSPQGNIATTPVP